MTPYIAVLAVLAVMTGVMGVESAYGSCESIEECTYANLERDKEAELSVLDVLIKPDERVNVPIVGTVHEGVERVTVTVSVRDPDGITTTHDVRSTAQETFSVIHPVTGTRNVEGTYTVSATYMYVEDLGYGPDGHRRDRITKYNIDQVEFTITLDDPDAADHTVNIQPGANIECTRTGTDACYDVRALEIDVGETVEWWNESDHTHNIHSVALGYGAGDVRIVDAELERTANYFSTNIIPPGTGSTVQFTQAGNVLYSCLLHPWMEGTIEVRGSAPINEDAPKSILDIKDREEEKVEREQKAGLVIPLERDSYAPGELLRLEFPHPRNTGSQVITLEDPDGRTVEKRTARIDDRTARASMIIQPTWGPGEYHIVASYRSVETRVPVTITQGVQCMGYESGHGPDSGCFAGRVTKISDGDTLTVGRTAVTLTISVPDNATKASVEELCPIDSIAIVDRDNSVLADSRITESFMTRAYLGAVYCGSGPESVNQQLVRSGLSIPDDLGCVTSEFASWNECKFRPVAQPEEEEKPRQQEESDCPIALAVYGTDLAVQVQKLREHRDSLVSSGWAGAFDAIHTMYYAVAPYVADMQRDSPELNRTIRAMLAVPLYAAAYVGDHL